MTPCIFCDSIIGKDIGGYHLGMHWKTPVAVCDRWMGSQPFV